jgi:hypothetical protein
MIWQETARAELRRRFPDLLLLMKETPTLVGTDRSITRDDLLFEEGWLPLVIETCELLEASVPPQERSDYHIVQIKEKWGELRIHMTKTNPLMYEILMSARSKSMNICEVCGQPGVLTKGLGNGFLVQTVCQKHADEKRRNG